MKVIHEVPKRSHINVIELLVAEEVDLQLQVLAPRVAKYLKATEVETYALNRLPALYASSEKGWHHQYEKAKRELHNQIRTAVRQAIAAVQIDPLRSSEPLQFDDGDGAAQGALNTLRELLKQPDLSWDGIVDRLKTLLVLRSETNQAADLRMASSSVQGHHRTGDKDTMTSGDDSRSRHWRPGTYGSDLTWQKRHVAPSGTDGFAWDDPRYSK
ncbi:MAG: late competence development ComFB family protein [Cyanobacteriota bacterium]|nr:late competence development ComFB family protein [Cyanobacteriota bacterium]